MENLTKSPPSVPREEDHAVCRREIKNFTVWPTIPTEISYAPNSIWEMVHSTSDGRKFRYYGSEDDVAYLVRRFLESILSALKLNLDFNAEVTIKHIRPDLCVLLRNMHLVDVVEVKKPGASVLSEPTVLGELLDQMLLVEGFYGMGPVIGILTTGEEWLVSWFPADSSALEVVNSPCSGASFTTPMKQKATEAKGHSPTGGTPSQQIGTIHSIPESEDLFLFPEFEDEVSPEMDRLLCATHIMNIYRDPIDVLKHLCGAFQFMAAAHLYHTANISRCLLKFHKGIHAVTFHPMSYDEVYKRVNFNKRW